MNPPLTVMEADGAPKITMPTTLVFPNGSLARQGGKVTVSLMSAGGNVGAPMTGPLQLWNHYGTASGQMPLEFGTTGTGFTNSNLVVFLLINSSNLMGFNGTGASPGINLMPTWEFGWSPSAPNAAADDTGLRRLAPKVVMATDGTNAANGWFVDQGTAKVTAQFDVTSSAALADIPGLSVALIAGRTYSFKATLYTASNSASGIQFAIGGTATATSIIYEAEVVETSVLKVPGTTRASALATKVGDITAVAVARCVIIGTIVVNAAGTLTVRFAQNVSGGTASSVLVGSVLEVRDMR